MSLVSRSATKPLKRYLPRILLSGARGLCLSFLALTSSFFDGGRRGWMLPLLRFDVPGGVAGESDSG